MDTLLKTYFPIIRTREEVLNLIGEKEKLTNLFESWSEEQQEEFLDFCTGVKGNFQSGISCRKTGRAVKSFAGDKNPY